MSDETSRPSFWTTLPGVLTAIAAVLTAVGGLITALALSNDGDASPIASSAAPNAPILSGTYDVTVTVEKLKPPSAFTGQVWTFADPSKGRSEVETWKLHSSCARCDAQWLSTGSVSGKFDVLRFRDGVYRGTASDQHRCANGTLVEATRTIDLTAAGVPASGSVPSTATTITGTITIEWDCGERAVATLGFS